MRELKEYKGTILVIDTFTRIAESFIDEYWFNIKNTVLTVESLVRNEDGSYTVIGKKHHIADKSEHWYTEDRILALKYRKQDRFPKPYVKKALFPKNRKIIKRWKMRRYATEAYRPFIKMELPAGTILGFHGGEGTKSDVSPQESVVLTTLSDWVKSEALMLTQGPKTLSDYMVTATPGFITFKVNDQEEVFRFKLIRV